MHTHNLCILYRAPFPARYSIPHPSPCAWFMRHIQQLSSPQQQPQPQQMRCDSRVVFVQVKFCAELPQVINVTVFDENSLFKDEARGAGISSPPPL